MRQLFFRRFSRTRICVDQPLLRGASGAGVAGGPAVWPGFIPPGAIIFPDSIMGHELDISLGVMCPWGRPKLSPYPSRDWANQKPAKKITPTMKTTPATMPTQAAALPSWPDRSWGRGGSPGFGGSAAGSVVWLILGMIRCAIRAAVGTIGPKELLVGKYISISRGSCRPAGSCCCQDR